MMVITSPAAALMEPFEPLPSEAAPKVVGSVPPNVPAAPSVRVTVSISPVRSLRTPTTSVPSPARSASVTERVRSPPTTLAVMEGVPGTPPAMGSVALTCAGLPIGRATSS